MKEFLLCLLLALTCLNIFAQDDIITELKAQFESQKYDRIITKHAKKADKYPAKAIYYIAMAYFMKTDDNNCLKYMDLSISKDDSDPDTYFIKGATYNYLGQYDKAIASFEKAISLDSTNSRYYSDLGDSYLQKEQFDLSLAAFQEATQKEPPLDRPFSMIPYIYRLQNQPVKALEAYYTAKNKISKESDSYITALYNIGLYEILNRNYDKAEPAFVELLKLAPNDFQSYAKLIQVFYGKKEYEKAEPYRLKLYEAYKKGVLKDNMKEMFCFDQFDWNDYLIQVFERFAVKEGKLYYKHLFYVVNKEDEIQYRIQTENSPISEEMGGPKYILGMDKEGVHYSFRYGFKEDFKYENLKKAIISVLAGEVKPSASTRPAIKKE